MMNLRKENNGDNALDSIFDTGGIVATSFGNSDSFSCVLGI
jgi:hypothetical protein